VLSFTRGSGTAVTEPPDWLAKYTVVPKIATSLDPPLLSGFTLIVVVVPPAIVSTTTLPFGPALGSVITAKPSVGTNWIAAGRELAPRWISPGAAARL